MTEQETIINALNGLKNADIKIDDEIRYPSIKALEKQIAKKPIGISVNEDNMRLANCPSCKKLIVQKENPVGCKYCLQALYWGE